MAVKRGICALKRLRNWLLFLIIVLIWSSNWSVMKIGLSYVDPLNFVLHRLLFSALALSPLLGILKERVPKDMETLTRLLLLGVINASGIFLTNIGLLYEKSGISAVLTYTQPLFVFCMAVLFLKEEANASRLLGVLTGFSGVVALSLGKIGSIESFPFSNIFLIIGAFLWAVSVVYYKKLLNQVNSIVTNIIQLAVGAIILTLLNALFGEFYFPLSRAYVPIVLYASVGASSLALTIWMFLLREEEATVLSSSSFIIPMAALFFGWLLLGENIELKSLLGTGLILAGVYLVNRT
ncbi:MAG: DMT family transporter [Candidatus Bathyarchaeia archaeon]